MTKTPILLGEAHLFEAVYPQKSPQQTVSTISLCGGDNTPSGALGGNTCASVSGHYLNPFEPGLPARGKPVSITRTISCSTNVPVTGSHLHRLINEPVAASPVAATSANVLPGRNASGTQSFDANHGAGYCARRC